MKAPAGTPEYDELAKLVQDLENLAADEAFARMNERLRLAESIEGITVDERLGDWKAAKLRIQESDKYHGLTFEPQVGLVPLGRDPESGLEEFLHFETHVGEIPRRDENRHLPPITGDTGLVFVLIPGGSGPFRMGAQSTDPKGDNYDALAIDGREELHEEPTVGPFFLSKYEMTQGQWQRFVGTNPSGYRKVLSPIKPVNRVSWYDCDKTMHKLALILPHEVQWEYAARAGMPTAWWTGPDERSLEGAENIFDEAAAEQNPNWSQTWDEEAAPWYDGQKAERIRVGNTGPTTVGTYRPNGFGLFDVGGNVHEWCANRIGYRGPRPAGRYPSIIARGGSFKRGVREARSASRLDSDPSVVSDEIGLRPAMAIQ